MFAGAQKELSIFHQLYAKVCVLNFCSQSALRLSSISCLVKQFDLFLCRTPTTRVITDRRTPDSHSLPEQATLLNYILATTARKQNLILQNLAAVCPSPRNCFLLPHIHQAHDDDKLESVKSHIYLIHSTVYIVFTGKTSSTRAMNYESRRRRHTNHHRLIEQSQIFPIGHLWATVFTCLHAGGPRGNDLYPGVCTWPRNLTFHRYFSVHSLWLHDYATERQSTDGVCYQTSDLTTTQSPSERGSSPALPRTMRTKVSLN